MLTFPCVGEADRHDYFSHLGHMLAVHFLRSKWNHLENSADSLKFHHLPLKPELGTRNYFQCVALKSKKNTSACMLSRPILTRMQIFPASTVLETTWYKILVRNKNSNVYKKWIKKNKYKKYSIQCKKMCKHKQNAKLKACLFGTFFQLQSLRTFDASPPQAHTAQTFRNFLNFRPRAISQF